MGLAQARAQSPGNVTQPPPPSAQALGLARALVGKTEQADVTTLPWLGMPMGAFMQHLHISPHEHGRIIFREALLPVLQKHAADFAEIEAQTYAADMSLDDLKAVNAFYDSPAGLALLRMHAPLLKMNEVAIAQLLKTLKPEIENKVDGVMKAHGWKVGGDVPSPPTPPSSFGLPVK